MPTTPHEGLDTTVCLNNPRIETDLKSHLIQRGYKQEEIHDSIPEASGKRRDETPNNH